MTTTMTKTAMRICRFRDVEEDEGLRVEFSGVTPLAVWRVGEAPYVTDDTCTHGAASLVNDGLQDDFVIECGLHQGAFDIRTGKIESAPCTIPLRVYKAWLEGDDVYADLSSDSSSASAPSPSEDETTKETKTDPIAKAANILRTAELELETCAPVRDLFEEADVASAYKVQQVNIARRLEDGKARIVGHKIGLTSRAVQEQVGVDTPDYGVLLSDMVVDDGGILPLQRLLQPRAEAEIAIILSKDLDMPSPNVADVLLATEYVLPSIEIVDSRVKDWDISIVDTIADNASCGMFVLGTPAIRPAGFEFATCEMELRVNGKVVSTGAGRACLGNPLNGAAWLARQMQELGTPLKAGEIILTGALGPLAKFDPGDSVEARIGGLGSASFKYGD